MYLAFPPSAISLYTHRLCPLFAARKTYSVVWAVIANGPLMVLPSCTIPASETLWARHTSGIHVYRREVGWETNEGLKLLPWDVSGDSCAGKHDFLLYLTSMCNRMVMTDLGKHEWSSRKVRGWRDEKFDHLGRFAMENRYYKEESYRIIVWILDADGASMCVGQPFTNVGLPRTICIWNPYDI